MPGPDVSSFVTVSQVLWSPEKGFPTIADASLGGQRPHDFKGKLRGRFDWPFSLKLPDGIDLSRGEPSRCKLPASFAERQSRVTINYRITAIVIRGILSTPHT